MSAREDITRAVLAARARVGLARIAVRRVVSAEGVEAGAFLARLTTRDARALPPGACSDGLMLADGGGVIARVRIARLAQDLFLLWHAGDDGGWTARAARGFDMVLRDVSDAMAVTAVRGPRARAVLRVAGMAQPPQAGRFAGARVAGGIAHVFAAPGGYDMACAAKDAEALRAHLAQAGEGFGAAWIDDAAMDVLELETGMIEAGRDFVSAATYDDGGFSALPSPASLGLEALVERDHHGFNGRAGWRDTPDRGGARLAALDALEDGDIAPGASVRWNEAVIGTVTRAAWSPALQRPIALAWLAQMPAPGASVRIAAAVPVSARVVTLPFLPWPEQVDTEQVD